MRLDLKTGFSCNNRCAFCVQGDRRARDPDRDTATLKRLLDEGRAHADEVVLTGGECTIRPDILALVRHARAAGYRVVQIQTNGRRLSQAAFCDALLAAGATEVSPALHGALAETHDAQTGAPGSFRQTVQGIRNVVARGGRVITNSVVTRRNLRELPRLGELLVGLGVAQYQLAMVHPLGSAQARFDEVVPPLHEAAPWVKSGLRPGIAAGIPVMAEAMPACLMVGFEAQIAEAHIPETRIEDVGRVVPDYRAARVGEGKAKGPPCEACTWSPACEGPWREYPERHGWEGFVPRSDTPPTLGGRPS
ncbi:MAG: radical SAM protein [Myxococcota bacterium]